MTLAEMITRVQEIVNDPSPVTFPEPTEEEIEEPFKDLIVLYAVKSYMQKEGLQHGK